MNIRPTVTDGVIIKDGKVLLIKRKNFPERGKWALPGGYIQEGETVAEGCEREVKEETGLEVKAIEIVGVFDDPARDIYQNISVAYMCEIVGGELNASDDAEEVKWFELNDLPELAFDHADIVNATLEKKRHCACPPLAWKRGNLC